MYYLADFSQEDVKGYWGKRNGKKVFIRTYNRKGDDKKSISSSFKEGLNGTLGAAAIGGTAVVGAAVLPEGIRKAAQANWDYNFPKRVQMITKRADEIKVPDIGNAKQVIITMGGIRQGGEGGAKLAEYFRKDLGKDVFVIDLKNSHLDIPDGKLGIDTPRQMMETFAGNVFKEGYNRDSIEIAAMSEAVHKKYGIRPDIVGFSAGGVAGTAAAADLEKMGSKDFKFVSIGSPYNGVVSLGKDVEHIHLAHKTDKVAGNLSTATRDHLVKFDPIDPPKGVKRDLIYDHSMDHYMTNPEVKKTLYKFLKDGYRMW